MLPYSKCLVIIPTYNESENIVKMVSMIQKINSEINILIVDDNSPDGTARLVKDLQVKNLAVHLIEREGKLGLGTAYITGFKWALKKKFDFIFEMDCDFSHDPNDIPRLLEEAQRSDLVIGSRYTEGIRVVNWPFHRLLLSYGAGFYVRFITGLPVQDSTGGFKCFRRETLEKIDLDRIISNGYSFQIELNYKVWKKGLKVKEIPIIFYERRNGHSKMNNKIVIEALLTVFKLRFKGLLGHL